MPLVRIDTVRATGSHRVMAGGSIEKLKEILGHYSATMTERYTRT